MRERERERLMKKERETFREKQSKIVRKCVRERVIENEERKEIDR